MSDKPDRPSLVWIAEGTAEWEAWRKHRTGRGLRIPTPLKVMDESGAGWWFPRTLPTGTPPLSSTPPISAPSPTKNSEETAKPAKRPRNRRP